MAKHDDHHMTLSDEQEQIASWLIGVANEARQAYAVTQSFQAVPSYVENQLNTFASATPEDTLVALTHLGYLGREGEE